MNPRMWAHPATQANAELVRSRGAILVGPAEGDTAEGEQGLGRMAEPEEVARRCEELLFVGPLRGKRVLVSAGGTREPLDAVRFVGNRASGRMGVALAEEARRRGADVTLLAANLAVPPPGGVEVVETPTTQAMLEAALARADADLVLMAAAPADYRPSEQRADKRRRTRRPDVELEADPGHPACACRATERWRRRRVRGRLWRARSRARTREAHRQAARPDRLQRRVPLRPSASTPPTTRWW